MTIIYFILILGITVLVHEFGHFIFAKKFGVHVYEFSLGMGPRLFKFNRKNDETDYCIRLFPIGGFVQMAGEEIEVDEKIPEEKRLMSKPAYQRFIIMVAGVMMNFLLAIVLLFVIGLNNTISTDSIYINESRINGLATGDKIVSIDGHFVNNHDKLMLELTCVGSKKFNIEVQTKDGKKNFEINPIGVGKSNLVYGVDYGFNVTGKEEKGKEQFYIKNSKVSGLKNDSVILSINGTKVIDYNSLLNLLNDADDSFELEYKYKEKTSTKTIKTSKLEKDELYGYNYGFDIKGHDEKGLFAAIKFAFVKFFSTLEQMIFTILYLVTGRLSLKLLSGPVGIYTAVGIYSKAGFAQLLYLLSLICVNVGFINLLPLPAFDGGHVLFIIIEKIKGSKVNPKVENIIHTIGFALLMILMIFITYNDILKLFK